MKKIFFGGLAAILITICTVVLLIFGDTYECHIILSDPIRQVSDYDINIEQDKEIIEITDKHIDGNKFYLTIKGISRGKAFVSVSLPDSTIAYSHMFYVHTGGIVTHGYFLGSCTGGEVIQLSVFIYLLSIIVFLIIEQIKEQKKNLYQYRNVRRLGAIIFLIPMLFDQTFMLINIVLGNGLIYNIHSIISSVETFTFFCIPCCIHLISAYNDKQYTAPDKRRQNFQKSAWDRLRTAYMYWFFPSLFKRTISEQDIIRNNGGK